MVKWSGYIIECINGPDTDPIIKYYILLVIHNILFNSFVYLFNFLLYISLNIIASCLNLFIVYLLILHIYTNCFT